MKPVELVFKGLNSYTDEARIDFEKLHKAGIFGIFGETGAGKTTILDAITIALYSKLDRVQSISEVTNPAVGKVYVKFKFEINGTVYEVYREFENGTAKIQTLYKYDGNMRYPIADKAREINDYIQKEIIGLNFDDFTKVVILPQGKFSMFLDSRPAEKMKILGKIFGTDVFGEKLFNSVKNRKDLISERISNQSNQLEELKDIDAQKIKALEKEQEKIKYLLLNLKKQKRELEENYRILTRLQELLEEKKEIERNIHRLKEREPEIKKLKEKLEIAEKLSPLSIVIQSIKKTERRREELEKSIETLRKELEESELNYLRKKQEWDNFIQKKYPEVMGKLQVILENARKAKKKLDEKEKLEREIKNLEETLNATRSQLAEYERISALFDEVKKKLEEAKLSTEDERFLKEETRIISLKNRIEHLKDQLGRLESKFLHEKNQFSRKLSENLQKARIPADTENPIDTIRKLLDKTTQLRKERENLLREMENLNLAVTLAQNLKEGEPCPVCGSIQHPAPRHEKVEVREIEKLREEINTLGEKEKELIGIFERSREIFDRINTLESQYKQERLEIEQNLTSIEDEILKIAEKLACKSLDCAFKKLEELRVKKDKFDRLLSEERNLNERLRSLQGNREKSKLIELELNQMRMKVKELEKEISDLTEKKHPEEVIKAAQKKLTELEQRKNNLKSGFEEIKKQYDETETNLKTKSSLLKETDSNLIEYRRQLESEARKLNMPVEKLIKSILSEDEIKNLRSEINQYEKTLNTFEIKMKRVEEERKKLPYKELPDDEPDKTKKYLESVNEEFEKLNIMLGKITGEIQEARKKLEAKNRLERELVELNKIRANLSELYSLFHGKKFSKFVARFYLSEIIREANKFLQELTAGRLKIVGTKGDDIEFQIFDSFTGHSRSTKSLSGGEKFLVSFSLAISFSLYIQRRSINKIDFFFIDEGFGTLDEDLQDAIGRIFEQIQGTGKLVGLITHVRKFREIVPAQIIVTRDPITKSSKIKIRV